MDKKKPQYETTLCPKCGRTSKVTAGNTLIACCRCAMSGASRLETGEVKESGLYDWPVTIEALKEAMGVSNETQVAIKLGLSKKNLSDVKHGLRPMPKEVLKLIRESWPSVLRDKKAALTAQDRPVGLENDDPARIVAAPPVFEDFSKREPYDAFPAQEGLAG